MVWQRGLWPCRVSFDGRGASSGRDVLSPGEPHELKDALDAFGDLLFLSTISGSIENCFKEADFRVEMSCRNHVLKDGEIGQQPHQLKSPNQPQAGYGVGLQTGDVFSLKGYFAAGGRDEAGHEVDGVRLAGPIRTYQATVSPASTFRLRELMARRPPKSCESPGLNVGRPPFPWRPHSRGDFTPQGDGAVAHEEKDEKRPRRK